MFEKAAMMFLYSMTPSHVGAGESVTVDLAIQRNPTTGWPIIQASSLKGALRSAAPASGKEDADKRAVAFGFDAADRRGLPQAERVQPADDAGTPENTDETQQPDAAAGANGATRSSSADTRNSGALAIGDANILAFPVTSLAGVFGWVTCPAAIRELQRIWSLLPNVTPPETGNADVLDPRNWTPPKKLDDETAYVQAESQLKLEGDEKIVLQDVVLRKGTGDGITEIAALAAWLVGHALASQPPQISEKLGKDLVLVSDDTFTSLVESGIHIITRVKIDDDSGTVARSGPWDEELLPAETLLFSPVFAGGSRSTTIVDADKKRVLESPDEVLNYFTKEVARPFQIGAGATVGWGFMSPATME